MDVLFDYAVQAWTWFTSQPWSVKLVISSSLGFISFAAISFAVFKATAFSFTGIALSFSFTIFPPARAWLLEIPNHEKQPLPRDAGNYLSWLTWRAAVSEFKGREEEWERLKAWAKNSEPRVDIQIITAPGGSGKTRLAAQFADYLKKKGWNAGFLRRPMPLNELKMPCRCWQGIMFIIDYPENDTASVARMLEDLANNGGRQRIRVLLLTRAGQIAWDESLLKSKAYSLVRERPMELNRLSHAAGHAIFLSAFKKAGGEIATAPTEQELGAWMDKDKDRPVKTNSLALFLVAAALYSSEHPEEHILTFSGPKIIEALVKREKGRLLGLEEGAGLPANSLSLAITYATLCKGVPIQELRKDESLQTLLGLNNDNLWINHLTQSAHVQDGILRNLEPDIVGADFVHSTLAANEDKAPLLVFLAAARDPKVAIGTFGRLIYDAQVTMGRIKPHIQDWLLEALKNDEKRCAALWSWANTNLPHSLAKCGEYACRRESKDEGEQARLLGRLGVQLAAQGRALEAFEPSLMAVILHRRLAEQNPNRFAGDLSVSLTCLSNCLGELGQHKQALDTIREAVELYRQLAAHNPARFVSDLAASLNNLSGRLSNMDQIEQALKASIEAVGLYRTLAEQNPANFEPFLAGSLINHSDDLAKAGENERSMEVILEAVVLYRKLAEQNPAAFESDLSTSLNNLAVSLCEADQPEQGLEAIHEAVAIRRRLAGELPLAFAQNLAQSLGNLSMILTALNRHEEAAAAKAEAEEVERCLEEAREAARKQAEG